MYIPALLCRCGMLSDPKLLAISYTYGTNHPQFKQCMRVAHVPHACAVCVTRMCCACNTHGILSLWLHMCAKLMTNTHSTCTNTVCTHGNMHTQFLHTR